MIKYYAMDGAHKDSPFVQMERIKRIVGELAPHADVHFDPDSGTLIRYRIDDRSSGVILALSGHDHPTVIADWSDKGAWRRQNMSKFSLSSAVVILALVTGINAQSQSQPKPSTSKSADKVADQILAEQKEEEDLSWYGNVYPALKRKYGKPVSRQLYDAWREKFVTDVLLPFASKKGYDTSMLREQFLKATEKQPSN